MERHPRLRRPNRNQLQLRSFDLEELVPADHLARAIWAVVETLDLRALYDKVGSVEGGPGAPATDPAVLLALWLFATCEGVGSARELDRRCHRDAPYMWLCGGLSTNHTTLALFRVRHPEFLDSLLASSVATLVTAGFISLETIAVDGRRIRANAGAASFRTRGALESLHHTAAAAVQALRAQLDDEDSGDEAARRAAAARRRADEERLQRIGAALEAIEGAEEIKARNRPKRAAKAQQARQPRGATEGAPSLFPTGPAAPAAEAQAEDKSVHQDAIVTATDVDGAGSTVGDHSVESPDAVGNGDGPDEPGAPPTTPMAPAAPMAPTPAGAGGAAGGSAKVQEKGAARASTTDADATIMKMADGGYRPAYNCQTIVSADQSVVLAVSVECIGSDGGLLQAAVRAVEEKYNIKVKNALADGGYVNLKAIEALEGRAEPVTVYAPPPRPRGEGSSKRDRYTRLPGDSELIGRWRERLGTDEGKATYRRRSQVAELPHAGYANRRFNQTRTRGRDRVRSELLLQAIANNLAVRYRLLGRTTPGR